MPLDICSSPQIKADMEKLIELNTEQLNLPPAQIIRIEQAPLKITTALLPRVTKNIRCDLNRL